MFVSKLSGSLPEAKEEGPCPCKPPNLGERSKPCGRDNFVATASDHVSDDHGKDNSSLDATRGSQGCKDLRCSQLTADVCACARFELAGKLTQGRKRNWAAPVAEWFGVKP